MGWCYIVLDLLIQNACIVDGTGNSAFCGSIAVEDGVIREVVQGDAEFFADKVIDAKGRLVVPGFVDIHRHGDLLPFAGRGAEEIRLGVTSFVNGNCGFSPAPSAPEYFSALREYARPIMGLIPEKLCGASFEQYLTAAANCSLYSNMGFLVGGGALRIAVKGFDASPMTSCELDKMCELLKESLQEGALGLSMGLMYVPENFFSKNELVRICRVAADMGRITTVHLRGEGSSLIESVREVVSLAEQTGGAFHISHLKAAGKKNWRFLVPRALEMLVKAREDGLDITFDVYPYTAGSTALYTLLPPEVQEGGVETMLDRLRDESVRRSVTKALRSEQTAWDNLVNSTGWDSVVLAGGRDAGSTVEEIAGCRGISPEECAIEILLEQNGNMPMVFHSMCERDMEEIMLTPGAIVVSDALYSEGGRPHPRRYGSQIRLLSRYADRMGFENAIRAVTALPAKRMGIKNRGLLHTGYAADILILDPENLSDTATYEEPVQYPSGIDAVFVNGKPATGESGELCGCYGTLMKW